MRESRRGHEDDVILARGNQWVVVLLVLVVLFCDSDRVGRGERSRASDACERRMRLLAWTERISYAEALPCSAAENSSPLSLRLYIRYGSSISISIDLSLIHGIYMYIGSNSSSYGKHSPYKFLKIAPLPNDT